jgi:hypothetical protein
MESFMTKHRNLPVKIVSRFEKNKDLEFWLSKTPEERIEAVEFLRSQYYALEGYTSIPRIIPHLEIRKRT